MASVAEIDGLTVSGAPPVVPAAAAAYSVRLLDSLLGTTYTGVAMRIRRDTGTGNTGNDDEADVAFDSGVISLDSAVSNFSAGGSNATTLGQFLNVGTVNGTAYTDADSLSPNTAAAYVDEWKDQSGNANHAEQSAPASQPQIHDGTVNTDLILENGKPALQFDQDGFTPITGSKSDVLFHQAAGGLAMCVLNPTANTQRLCVIAETNGTSSSKKGFVFAWDDRSSNDSGYYSLSAGTGSLGAITAIAETSFVGAQSLMAIEYDFDTGIFQYKDGTLLDSLSASKAPATGDATNDLSIGSIAGNNTYGLSGTMQELILYNAHDANRTTIEENINSDYLIYQPTDQPTSGLLYDYGSATGGTDAAAAYSVRQLSDKAILCMRIRRDMGAGNPGDDDEINIGFDANGDLDTQAISDFCGTGTGYVTRWWDQSVNGNHADQPVGGTGSNVNQPQIYNGTAVTTENGKPAIDFNGVGQYFQSNGFADDFNGEDVAMSFSSVSSPDVTGDFFMWGLSGTNSTWQTCYLRSTVNIQVRKIDDSSTSSPSTKTGSYSTGQQLFTAVSNGTTTSVYVDTSVQVNAASINVGASTFTTATVGASPTPSAYLNGQMQELVLWVADQSSNRTGIETNINDHFNIY